MHVVRIPSREELLEMVQGLPALRTVLEALAGAEPAPTRVALVGGSVRDLLIGLHPVDVDLVVEGPLSVLAPLLDDRAHSYDRFATLTLETDAGRVDVAQARRERYPHPGALPEVSPANIEQDLTRRDFTVNAIAVPITGSGAGELLAHPNALEDLRSRRLTVLHDNSFIDDPTRLLRLARYRARLRFDVDPHTFELARSAVAGGALATVSGQRIGSELQLLAGESDPAAALAALSELGVDSAIAPGLGLDTSDGAPAETLRGALRALPPDGRGDLVSLAVACVGVAEDARRALLDHLGFPASERDVILEATARATSLAKLLAEASKPSEIHTAIGTAAPETVALAAAQGEQAASEHAMQWLTSLRHVRLSINGDDLVSAGIEPGPAVGSGLAAAMAALLDGEAPDRDRQLRVALAAAGRQLG